MIRDVTFGQFFPGHSVVHRFDPRAKLLLCLLLMIFLFLAGNFWSLLLLGAGALTLMLCSGVPLRLYLRNIKTILPLLLFTALINLFSSPGGTVLLQWWIFRFTTDGLRRAVFLSLRILFLIFYSAILTYSTTPNDLTDAIERVLRPLRFIGLGGAVHTMAMMMTIALRFIPTLMEETEKILNAQKARGADLESGNLLRRIRAMMPILIPLLISAVRRAYDLAEAMECRCYHGGEGRTRMKQMHFSRGDFVGTALVLLLCAGVLVLNFFC